LRRAQLVRAVRAGASLRQAAARFGMSVGTAAHWVAHARGQRLDRVDFADRKSGRTVNRTAPALERRILQIRCRLREASVLGEYGPDAIVAALRADGRRASVPSRTTVYRVLSRHGALDRAHRVRRAAPPRGWYLPAVARGEAELDSFDFIEDLKIARGPLVSVLTATSLHGSLADAWIMPRASAQATVLALCERWQRDGLPTYAQFDNDTIFQGAHQFADTVGRVSRLCLALGVVPVFAPPREPGLQNAIEGFNALWQAKVWQRHQVRNAAHATDVSNRYIAAHRAKTAPRREHAPRRRPWPRGFRFEPNAPLAGTMIFVRRSNDHGAVTLLGRSFDVDPQWAHRLVRCEVDFTHERIRLHALRRRAPEEQPLLRQLDYPRPTKPFKGKP
jgi:transposase-like protein